jgi:protein SCO1/2
MLRRNFLTSFARFDPPEDQFKPAKGSPGPTVFTNALLTTHEGKQVRFYDDLVRGRQVLINLMYADCHGLCPAVTERLLKVYSELKDRMGKNLFLYSMTVKPEEDDPAALKEYAKMHNAYGLPGWIFLTGDPYDMETIRFRLFKMDHIGVDIDIYSHTSFMQIINDGTNRWLHVDPMATLPTVLRKISWANPPLSFEEKVKANKKLQERINQEKKLWGYRKDS